MQLHMYANMIRILARVFTYFSHNSIKLQEILDAVKTVIKRQNQIMTYL